ncbi:MAG: UDP-N-acetylmuramoyl-tripeptide--D-alanyl-D-alanine ligase [Bacteroidota bacterium]|nr:UDP-N-acetylmuramoyl-tripeptide--D-alanyl-D-alanine ligase [Bacteroidota bacterium]
MNIDSIYTAYLDSNGICTNSKALQFGQMFWAIVGENFDGNDYVEKAIKDGAKYAVTNRKELADVYSNCFYTADTLLTIQMLATKHRRALGIPIIAIAGSNGKTTTKELLYYTLKQVYSCHVTQGNLNNHLGVPITLLQLTESIEIAVVELGANHQGENKILLEIVEPNIVIITNTGKDHLEGFGGIEGVVAANMEVVNYAKQHQLTWIKNLDDIALEHTIVPSIIAYGDRAEIHCDVVGNYPYLNLNIYHNALLEILVETRLFGSYNKYNVMACVAVCKHLGIDLKYLRNAGLEYYPDNNRSQLIKLGNLNVIMDAYNANPSSMESAIMEFSKYYPKGQRTAKGIVIGFMAELGADEAKYHEEIVQFIQSCRFDLVIFTHPAYSSFSHLCANGFYLNNAVDNVDKILELIKLRNIEIILFKGSRVSKLEIVLEALKK